MVKKAAIDISIRNVRKNYFTRVFLLFPAQTNTLLGTNGWKNLTLVMFKNATNSHSITIDFNFKLFIFNFNSIFFFLIYMAILFWFLLRIMLKTVSLCVRGMLDDQFNFEELFYNFNTVFIADS